MNVDVFDLAQTGEARSGVLSIGTMPRLQPQLAAGADGEVRYTLQGLTDAQRRPAARLTLHATLSLPCTHCDKPVPFVLDAQRDYYFVRDERALEVIDVDDAEEEPLVGDKRFDLAQLIEDELILGLPIAPRHPACQDEIEAAEAASGSEAGQAAPTQRPFAVLASLKSHRG